MSGRDYILDELLEGMRQLCEELKKKYPDASQAVAEIEKQIEIVEEVAG